MPKKKIEEKHSKVRKAVFIALALVLVGVMGKLVIEAVGFVSANAAARNPDNMITGMAYTISGGDCKIDENSVDCCEKACSSWCTSKGTTVVRVGVLEPIDVRCKCTCLQ